MLKEKRTIMEMMAELDVDDQSIFESQERIAKKNTQISKGSGDSAPAKEDPKKKAAGAAAKK